MALFSRRDKIAADGSATPAAGGESADSVASVRAGSGAGGSQPAAEVPAEPVPHVGISVSTFGQAAPPKPAPAPAPTPAIPGIQDNALLHQALLALPDDPQGTDIMNVMRQALQGPLYVRAQGDAQALLAAGEGLNLAITSWDDKRFLLAFSSGAALQASAAAEDAAATSAVGQPAHAVFRTAIDGGYDGVYLDHATPGSRIVLPIQLISKAIDEGAPVPFELKSLLAGPRSDESIATIAEVLTRVPVWVAGNTDPSGRMGLAEARSENKRLLEVYSHPLEVIAMGRGDRPLPLTAEQLGKTLASETGIDGIVIDAAGPWAELDRAALAPVLALAG